MTPDAAQVLDDWDDYAYKHRMRILAANHQKKDLAANPSTSPTAAGTVNTSQRNDDISGNDHDTHHRYIISDIVWWYLYDYMVATTTATISYTIVL